MKYIAYTFLIVSLVTLANGAVAFFFRYNFVSQERYGPSMAPIYIIGAGILLGVIGLALNTKRGRSRHGDSA
ncbi:MAG TPA: hypothetical protein VM487_12450 [Phycisphaerae bacterium]|nr:hypothetical protein [Phycisphaerae bacterium]